MQLYYSPGACSLAPHIVLREAGVDFEAVKVDGRAKKTVNGEDYWQVTAKGYVPALRLDNGEVLTECTAVMQYVSDQNPGAQLSGPAGSFARYRVLEWLGYISTELHKGFGVFFTPGSTDAQKQAGKDSLSKKFTWVQSELGNKTYLLGDQYTIADSYLFTILGWTNYVGIDLGAWPGLKAYHARVAARPQVQAALKAEALIK
jgi:glutathione S-transferase